MATEHTKAKLFSDSALVLTGTYYIGTREFHENVMC